MCKTRIQEEIEVLMSLYHLGKAPLSYALGFGEVTITRYLQGSTPHPDYAQVIHNALCDIDYMMGLVNKNHEKMGPAFKKAINRCLTLKSQFSCSKEILQVISYMEQFYNILKESLNEEMGWMIDHIYEDYKNTEDILGFALSCEKILRLYFGTDIHEQLKDLLIYVLYVYLDYDEDKIELLLNDYDPEHNRYIQ